MSEVKYHPYPRYKPSGVAWLGNMPSEWGLQELRYLADVKFSGVDKKSYDGQRTVSLCNYTDVYYQTYITTNLEFMQATASEDEIARFELKAGDVIVTKDSESWDDIAIPAYVPDDLPNVICGYHLALIRSRHNLGAYLFWCFMSRAIAYQFNVSANGITRFGLSQQAIKNAVFPIPPLPDQHAIAIFLDRETAKIDDLIAKKQRLLELFAEKRQALITHAVTKGLDPDVPMKDSGVEWLGEIPEGWEVEYAKWLFQEIDIRSDDGGEDLLTVSHITGVTLRAEKDVNMFMAETREGYKKCKKGDLVINTLWAWMGAMGTAPQDGIVSPAYNVYRPLTNYYSEYIDFLVRITVFAQEVIKFSRGVWSSRLRLYPAEFFSILLPIPPFAEQVAIADYLDKQTDRIDRLRQLVEEAIERLKERRITLITEAVTGQIDVRGKVVHAG